MSLAKNEYYWSNNVVLCFEVVKFVQKLLGTLNNN